MWYQIIIIETCVNDFWMSVFTDAWIATGDVIGDYVGIRTVIQYDALRK